MNIQPYWIGYHDINQWLNAIDKTQPVFANLTTELGNTDHRGLRIDHLVILVAQPAGDLLHYWRLVVGELRFIDNESFDGNHKQRRQTAEQTWQSVQDWLAVHNLIICQGVVAALINVRLLDSEPL